MQGTPYLKFEGCSLLPMDSWSKAAGHRFIGFFSSAPQEKGNRPLGRH